MILKMRFLVILFYPYRFDNIYYGWHLPQGAYPAATASSLVP